MKVAIFALFLVASAQAMVIFDAELDDAWEEFKQYHNKKYALLGEETGRRLTFEDNLKYVNQHNMEASLGHHTYTLAMNHFGDLTHEEFKAMYNGYNSSKTLHSRKEHTFMPASNVQIPDSVDWRTQGYVTPVKDQGQCGSCWAFSTTGSLEGQHFKKTGKLVSLSEQNLVDCSRKQGNMGCNGGLMDQAFTYIKVNGGIDTESSYPYEARDDSCRFKKENVGATDTGFTDIERGNEDDLTNAIATVGPISVAIDASHRSFQLYHDGIYNERACSPTNLDHGVLAIGYGSENGKDYYLVKNSWSERWGIQGYIKMSRNHRNQCGIATSASYPLV